MNLNGPYPQLFAPDLPVAKYLNSLSPIFFHFFISAFSEYASLRRTTFW